MLQLPERDLTAPLRTAMLARDPAALSRASRPTSFCARPSRPTPSAGATKWAG